MEGTLSGAVLVAVLGLGATAAIVVAALLYRVSRPGRPVREPRDG